MAESKYVFPEDLLQALRDFLAAEVQIKQIVDKMPSSVDVINLEAEVGEEQQQELDAAREAQMDAVMRMHRHEWWGSVENRYDAGLELRKAAQA